MPTSLITYCLLLFVFVLLMQAEAFTYIKKSRGLLQIVTQNGNISLLNKKHIVFTMLLTLVSVYWFSLKKHSHLLIFPTLQNERVLVSIILLLAAIMLGCSTAKKRFPCCPSFTMVLTSATSFRFILFRTFFLITYELFFRGALLFMVAKDVGERTAVAINVLLYGLVHSFSGRKEFIGTVPFGLLLCVISFWYQSVWPAVIIHLGLALSFEISVLFNQKSSIKTIRL